ncbi:MAG TPA: hypothetical protein PK304_04225 [Mobilitalea sp.]|nr:hypothetical protein [Mobilitalea sp.]
MMKFSKILFIALLAAVSFYGCKKEASKTVIPDAGNNDIISEEADNDNELSKNTGFNDNMPENTYNLKDNGISKSDDIDPDKSDTADELSSADIISNNNGKEADSKEQSFELEPAKLAVEIEGITEEIEALSYTSPLGYRIIFDPERFNLSREKDGSDRFMANNQDSDGYPDVYININILPETLNSDTITTDGKDAAEYVGEVSIGSFTAGHYKFKSGNNWNSVIRDYYIFDEKDKNFIIECGYFLEAQEGYGARIEAMLKTISVSGTVN